jgi:hypothetical protein
MEKEVRNVSGQVIGYRDKSGKINRKKKGADGKACWEGYRYQGTKNGRDRCVKVKD